MISQQSPFLAVRVPVLSPRITPSYQAWVWLRISLDVALRETHLFVETVPRNIGDPKFEHQWAFAGVFGYTNDKRGRDDFDQLEGSNVRKRPVLKSPRD